MGMLLTMSPLTSRKSVVMKPFRSKSRITSPTDMLVGVGSNFSVNGEDLVTHFESLHVGNTVSHQALRYILISFST